MSKGSAFLFYSENFLNGTMFMSNEQVGKYVRLLCAQHLTGHLAAEDMLKICAADDKEIWKKFTKDKDGKYYNKRLLIEVFKRTSYSKSRSENRAKKEVIKSDEIELSGMDTTWEQVFQEWINYRKSIRKPLKPQSLEGAFKRLKILSGDNPEKATRIINFSIDNGYQGLFPLKENEYKQSKTILEQWLS